MTTLTCLCGEPISGEGAEELFRATRAHSDAVHADLRLPDHVVREFVEAGLRATAPGERLEQIGTIEVKAVTPELVPDFLQLFDNEAFVDNPSWARCYCMYQYFTGSAQEWRETRAADNRAGIADLLSCGRAAGYLAYVDGKAAGWVNAAARSLMRRIDGEADHALGDSAGVGAISCFVIAPPYRRHGVARSLLEAAVAGFQAGGVRVVEAYPRKETAGDAEAYYGPLSLYLSTGFAVVHEAAEHVVVRRELTPA